MDRALKERIVGAIVLVVFIVLVVPVFLDGPVSDATVVTEAVSLPGQNGQESKRQTIVLERDRSEPVPVPAQAESRRESAPVVAPPPEPKQDEAIVAAPPPTAVVLEETPTTDPEPEPEAQIASTAVQSTTGMWAVQLGSYSNKTNAERLAAGLRSKGYAAFISQFSTANGQLHRVRIGPQKDRASAEAVAKRLAAEGEKGQVVPHP